MTPRAAVRAGAVLVLNRFLAWRASRERSVKNIAKANDLAAFETIYGDDALLREYLHEDRLAFYREIAGYVQSFGPGRVVDLGCGTGHLLAAVLERCGDLVDVVGVDTSTQAIERLREVVPSARGVVAPLTSAGLERRSFDVVLCTEVLEHLDDPAGAVEAMTLLCAPGGVIVVTVPDGETDTYEGHVNFWDEQAFAAFLSRFGDVEVARTSSGDLRAALRPAVDASGLPSPDPPARRRVPQREAR